MVYTADLKSAAFGHEGSNPSTRTNEQKAPFGANINLVLEKFRKQLSSKSVRLVSNNGVV